MEYLSKTHWDCECKENYIHANEVELCEVCGSHRDESPDSIQQEVVKYNK